MLKKHASADDEVEVNLTPMLDIVFIMLIFFIVTATFVNEVGIEVTKPNEDAPPPPPDAKPSTIPVAVTPDCWVRIQGRRLDPGQVAPNVQRLLAERPNGPGILTIEGDATTSCVAEVIAGMRDGGVQGAISLRTQEAP